MLPTTNLILRGNSKKVRNFDEDKDAVLEWNPGLRYDGIVKKYRRFSGQYYLLDQDGKLIEAFEIVILVSPGYPNAFPSVVLRDDHFDKTEDYHMDSSGNICLEHTYIANAIAAGGLRLIDFVGYYLPRYFSWALVKKFGDATDLKEWAHQDKGTVELYQILTGTTDRHAIKHFLERYLHEFKPRRNTRCYCGSDRKLKDCHWKEALFLHATPHAQVKSDLALFE